MMKTSGILLWIWRQDSNFGQAILWISGFSCVKWDFMIHKNITKLFFSYQGSHLIDPGLSTRNTMWATYEIFEFSNSYIEKGKKK